MNVWRWFLGLVLFVFLTERGSWFIGSPFLFVTFHFIINPILSLAFFIWVVYRVFKVKDLKFLLMSFVPLFCAGTFIYICVTGNIHWVEFIGIKTK